VSEAVGLWHAEEHLGPAVRCEEELGPELFERLFGED
jgi:hypothetical protein